MTTTYDVQMKVPLGIRKGVLRISVDGDTIEGNMRILGRTTEFSGRICDGRMAVSGVLRTVLRNMEFEGWGVIEDRNIEIKLKNKDSIYEITGKER